MRNVILVALAVQLSSSLFAALQFSGYFSTPTGTIFTLIDSDTNKESGWIGVGDKFDGVTIVAFQKDKDLLVVNKDGKNEEIRLRDSKVAPASFKVTGRITLGDVDSIDGVAAILHLGRESVFPLRDGVRLALKVEKTKDGNLKYTPRFLVKQKDGTELSNDSPSMIARPGDSFEMQVGEYGFSFVP